MNFEIPSVLVANDINFENLDMILDGLIKNEKIKLKKIENDKKNKKMPLKAEETIKHSELIHLK